MDRLKIAIAEAGRNEFEVFEYAWAFRSELDDLWSPSDFDAVMFSRSGNVKFSVEPPPKLDWAVAFTSTFKKSVEDMDKKMQGRILSAISELTEGPMSARGDTVKPLTGEHKGLWRYRVGDFRLVYEPRDKDRLLVLLEFGARGGIYES